MKVLITGGTGFVGSYLCEQLLDRGWHVTITGRSTSVHSGKDRFDHLVCDTTVEGSWQDRVASSDVIINLAGKNIFTPWNPQKKKEIRDSRILTTRNLVRAIPENSGTVFLSTSASGFYGSRGGEILDEDASMGRGFLAELCRDWENEAKEAEKKGARVVCMRFGMILGKSGGALSKMLLPFKLCLGGNLGHGDQWMSWMHLDDLASAVLFLIEQDKAKGPVNFCSPFAVRNRDFTKTLAVALGRPAFFHIPAFLLKALMGELGEVILGSQRMTASGLENLGFKFDYPEISQALDNIVS
jgi:hypothetical protein